MGTTHKQNCGKLGLTAETALADPAWPSRWPYGSEDFRPLDYTRDDVINTGPQYTFSQSLVVSDQATIFPGLLRLPVRRHWIFPKDKFALSEHMDQYVQDGAKVRSQYDVALCCIYF